MFANIYINLLPFAGLLFVFQVSLSCNSHLVQIIINNSSNSNAIVNQQNNFGDGNGGAGGLNVNIWNSPEKLDTTSDQPINLKDNHENMPQEELQFSQYFGVEFLPYVRPARFSKSEYTTEDIKDMLTVILTKSHSILTLGMEFEDQYYLNGAWNTTAPSQIATVAAQLNRDQGSMLVSISQGAGVLTTEDNQPDIEAAFQSALYANSIYPHTVWGITLIPNCYGECQQRNVETREFMKIISSQFQKHYSRTQKMNLKLGVFVDQCNQIMDGSIKEMLNEIAHKSDYIVCSIYPTQAVSEPQEYFNMVINVHQEIEQLFNEIAPTLEIILQTGWATSGKSKNNPEYMNSPKKSKQLWELMEKWANENKKRVFMHEAFDIPIQNENSSWGFWRWEDGGDFFEEKASENAVLI